VVKSIIGNTTISDVIRLKKEERVEEIAKLLSGKKSNQSSI
jgi:DNA repair ATPase RecN